MNKHKVFRDIYNTYWYKLYAYSHNILRDKESAEDITQEVFADLWNRFEKVEITHYKAYLYKAVKFQCAKKLNTKPFNDIQIEKIAYALDVSQDDESLNPESNEKLLKKVNQVANEILPKKCLEVYELRYKENLSYKDIANKLNITISTVDNQLHKALKLLRASDINKGLLRSFILLFFS